MPVSKIDSDLQVNGHFTATSMTLSNSAVSNAKVASDAAIDASKLNHDHRKTYRQEASANAAAGTEVIHNARAAGVVNGVMVGLVTPPDTAVGSSGRTVTVDVKKNGTTILSGTVTLNSTNVAYVATAGTVSVAPYVAGDTFTVVVTVGGSAGTHAKGLFVETSFYEGAG